MAEVTHNTKRSPAVSSGALGCVFAVGSVFFAAVGFIEVTVNQPVELGAVLFEDFAPFLRASIEDLAHDANALGQLRGDDVILASLLRIDDPIGEQDGFAQGRIVVQHHQRVAEVVAAIRRFTPRRDVDVAQSQLVTDGTRPGPLHRAAEHALVVGRIFRGEQERLIVEVRQAEHAVGADQGARGGGVEADPKIAAIRIQAALHRREQDGNPQFIGAEHVNPFLVLDGAVFHHAKQQRDNVGEGLAHLARDGPTLAEIERLNGFIPFIAGTMAVGLHHIEPRHFAAHVLLFEEAQVVQRAVKAGRNGLEGIVRLANIARRNVEGHRHVRPLFDPVEDGPPITNVVDLAGLLGDLPTAAIGQETRAGAITFGDDAGILNPQSLPGAAHHMGRIEDPVVGVEEVKVLIAQTIGQFTLPVAEVDVRSILRADAEDVNRLIQRGRIVGDDFRARDGFGSFRGEFDERVVHGDLH